MIIRPATGTGNKVIVQDQAGAPVLTTADSGATVANATLTAPTIADLSNVTGTLASGITFPTGHVTNIFSFHKNNGNEYAHFEDAHKVSQGSFGWSATSGRKYNIFSSMGHWPYISGNSRTAVWGDIKLWWGLTNRAQGSSTTDNQLAVSRIGRIVQTSTTGLHGYLRTTLQGHFTATSTATHYVYQTAISSDGHNYFRSLATTQADWNVIIFEVMP